MEDEQGCCWYVKKGRPDSIPECQDMLSLPHLEENETSCGQNGDVDKCFYFRCTTCMPFLGLDHYNKEYRNKIEFIPRVDSIKPKDKKLFSSDPGYHGEMVDFYDAYLSQIDGIKGIAVNSWKSEHACLFFDGVAETFKGTDFNKSKNFEIDWLLFLGGNLNVIEVGRRNVCEAGRTSNKIYETCKSGNESISEGTKKLIAEKIDQAIKNHLVMKKLLAATDCDSLGMNYFVVLPNIPIEEITSQLESKKHYLDAMILSSTANFGVISSDVIATQSVYLYTGNGKLSLESTPFRQFIIGSEDWTSNYRYVTSAVVISMLLTKKLHFKYRQIKPNQEMPLHQCCSKEECEATKDAVGWTKNCNSVVHFPKTIVLGPEQLKAMKSGRRVVLLMGEAGSGKTTVLLAVLFKYTGKHVDILNRKKVVFSIPPHKTTFRDDILLFVKQFCIREWVEIVIGLDQEKICKNNGSTIYLFDEIYDTDFLTHNLSRGIIYAVLIPGENMTYHSSLFLLPRPDVEVIYFRKIYRSPAEISKCCAKLKRLLEKEKYNSIDRSSNFPFKDIPWEMSFSSQTPLREASSIEVRSYSSLRDLDPGILDIKKSDFIVTLNLDKDKISELSHLFEDNNVMHQNTEQKYENEFTIHRTDPFNYESLFLICGERFTIDSLISQQWLFRCMQLKQFDIFVICYDNIRNDIEILCNMFSSTVRNFVNCNDDNLLASKCSEFEMNGYLLDRSPQKILVVTFDLSLELAKLLNSMFQNSTVHHINVSCSKSQPETKCIFHHDRFKKQPLEILRGVKLRHLVEDDNVTHQNIEQKYENEFTIHRMDPFNYESLFLICGERFTMDSLISQQWLLRCMQLKQFDIFVVCHGRIRKQIEKLFDRFSSTARSFVNCNDDSILACKCSEMKMNRFLLDRSAQTMLVVTFDLGLELAKLLYSMFQNSTIHHINVSCSKGQHETKYKFQHDRFNNQPLEIPRGVMLSHLFEDDIVTQQNIEKYENEFIIRRTDPFNYGSLFLICGERFTIHSLISQQWLLRCMQLKQFDIFVVCHGGIRKQIEILCNMFSSTVCNFVNCYDDNFLASKCSEIKTNGFLLDQSPQTILVVTFDLGFKLADLLNSMFQNSTVHHINVNCSKDQHETKYKFQLDRFNNQPLGILRDVILSHLYEDDNVTQQNIIQKYENEFTIHRTDPFIYESLFLICGERFTIDSLKSQQWLLRCMKLNELFDISVVCHGRINKQIVKLFDRFSSMFCNFVNCYDDNILASKCSEIKMNGFRLDRCPQTMLVVTFDLGLELAKLLNSMFKGSTVYHINVSCSKGQHETKYKLQHDHFNQPLEIPRGVILSHLVEDDNVTQQNIEQKYESDFTIHRTDPFNYESLFLICGERFTIDSLISQQWLLRCMQLNQFDIFVVCYDNIRNDIEILCNMFSSTVCNFVDCYDDNFLASKCSEIKMNGFLSDRSPQTIRVVTFDLGLELAKLLNSMFQNSTVHHINVSGSKGQHETKYKFHHDRFKNEPLETPLGVKKIQEIIFLYGSALNEMLNFNLHKLSPMMEKECSINVICTEMLNLVIFQPVKRVNFWFLSSTAVKDCLELLTAFKSSQEVFRFIITFGMPKPVCESVSNVFDKNTFICNLHDQSLPVDFSEEYCQCQTYTRNINQNKYDFIILASGRTMKSNMLTSTHLQNFLPLVEETCRFTHVGAKESYHQLVSNQFKITSRPFLEMLSYWDYLNDEQLMGMISHLNRKQVVVLCWNVDQKLLLRISEIFDKVENISNLLESENSLNSDMSGDVDYCILVCGKIGARNYLDTGIMEVMKNIQVKHWFFVLSHDEDSDHIKSVLLSSNRYTLFENRILLEDSKYVNIVNSIQLEALSNELSILILTWNISEHLTADLERLFSNCTVCHIAYDSHPHLPNNYDEVIFVCSGHLSSDVSSKLNHFANYFRVRCNFYLVSDQDCFDEFLSILPSSRAFHFSRNFCFFGDPFEQIKKIPLFQKATANIFLLTLNLDKNSVSQLSKNITSCTIKHVDSIPWSSDSLSFTGSEFDKVVVLCDENVCPDSRETVSLLYTAISRAKNKALVLCHDKAATNMRALLSLSTIDQIFEKLRYCENLGENLSSFLDSQYDVLEAFKRIIISKNETQFKSMKRFISECRDPEFEWVFNYVQSMLMSCFPWGHQIVSMLNNFLKWRQPLTVIPQVLNTHQFFFANFKTIQERRKLFAGIDSEYTSIKLEYDEMDLPRLKNLGFTATLWNQVDMLREVLKRVRVIISVHDDYYSHLLFHCVILNDISCASLILEMAPNRESRVFCLLKQTAPFIHEEMFAKLVQSVVIPPDVFLTQNLSEEPFQTMIHQLASTTTPECFTQLLSFGSLQTVKFSSYSLQDDLGRNVLMWAVCNSKICELLLDRAEQQGDLHALLSQKDSNGWSCLRHACYADNIDVVKLLVKEYSFKWRDDECLSGIVLLTFLNNLGRYHIKEFLQLYF